MWIWLYTGEKFPSFIVEKYEMVVKPEFEPRIHEWEGLLNYISLEMFLKREKLNKNYLQQT